jgi:tryptophan synthase alpha chain
VVVGSAIVEALKASLDTEGKATPRTIGAVTALVADIAKGVRHAAMSAG